MRYMVGDRSSSKAVLSFGQFLRLFIVPKDAKRSVQIEGMNEYLLFIPVMMMFKFRV